jgi:hypothetical protein
VIDIVSTPKAPVILTEPVMYTLVQAGVGSPEPSGLVTTPKVPVILTEPVTYTLVQSGTGAGPPGPPGPSGQVGDLTLLAYTNIGGGRVVRSLGDGYVNYVGSDEPQYASSVVGVTMGAAVTGATIRIQFSGELSDSGWNWVPGPIYCGLNGILTQSLPTTGFLLTLGTAISNTTILINIKQPLILS